MGKLCIKDKQDAIFELNRTATLLDDALQVYGQIREAICAAINEGRVKAPFKVGDCMAVRYHDNKLMIVERIIIKRDQHSEDFILCGVGPILKKNRQPSKRRGNCEAHL